MPKLIQTTAGFIIAFEIELCMICDDDPLCGLYLSQHNYWSATEGDRDGWICKTQEEWRLRTRLTRERQDRIRAYLKGKNFLEETLRGVPAKRHSRLNVDVIQDCLNDPNLLVGYPQTSLCETHKLDCVKPTNYLKKDLNLKKEIKKKEKPPLSPKGESEFSPGFLSFWEQYPKKVARVAAWRAWKAGKCEALADTIIASLATHEALKREQRRHIPNPGSYLNGKRWEDEVPARAPSEPVDLNELYRKAKEQYDSEHS